MRQKFKRIWLPQGLIFSNYFKTFKIMRQSMRQGHLCKILKSLENTRFSRLSMAPQARLEWSKTHTMTRWYQRLFIGALGTPRKLGYLPCSRSRFILRRRRNKMWSTQWLLRVPLHKRSRSFMLPTRGAKDASFLPTPWAVRRLCS